MELFYVLLILLLVTKACAEVAVRLKQPALIGELVGGVLVGISVMLLPESDVALADISSDATFEAILDLAVFFLMLLAGLEMRPGKLADVAGSAIPVAVGGMLLPLALGFTLGWFWLPESEWKFIHSLFLGVAVAITAVPVAVKVLMDLKQLESRVGQVVVAAAVLDDIFSLVLLAVLTPMISNAEVPTFGAIAMIGLQSALFLAIVWIVGRYVLPPLAKFIGRIWVEHAEFTVVLILGLGFAVLAELLGMHFLIGAFAAGLVITRGTIYSDNYEKLQEQYSALALGFFAPVFFASIGMRLDLSAATEIPLFVLTLLLFGILGKFVGSGLVAFFTGLDKRESIAVGAAMNARGAVGIIIADIALRAGLFDRPEPTPDSVNYMFSAIVIMAIATTLLSPFIMRAVLSRD